MKLTWGDRLVDVDRLDRVTIEDIEADARWCAAERTRPITHDLDAACARIELMMAGRTP